MNSQYFHHKHYYGSSMTLLTGGLKEENEDENE